MTGRPGRGILAGRTASTPVSPARPYSAAVRGKLPPSPLPALGKRQLLESTDSEDDETDDRKLAATPDSPQRAANNNPVTETAIRESQDGTRKAPPNPTHMTEAHATHQVATSEMALATSEETSDDGNFVLGPPKTPRVRIQEGDIVHNPYTAPIQTALNLTQMFVGNLRHRSRDEDDGSMSTMSTAADFCLDVPTGTKESADDASAFDSVVHDNMQRMALGMDSDDTSAVDPTLAPTQGATNDDDTAVDSLPQPQIERHQKTKKQQEKKKQKETKKNEDKSDEDDEVEDDSPFHNPDWDSDEDDSETTDSDVMEVEESGTELEDPLPTHFTFITYYQLRVQLGLFPKEDGPLPSLLEHLLSAFADYTKADPTFCVLQYELVPSTIKERAQHPSLYKSGDQLDVYKMGPMFERLPPRRTRPGTRAFMKLRAGHAIDPQKLIQLTKLAPRTAVELVYDPLQVAYVESIGWLQYTHGDTDVPSLHKQTQALVMKAIHMYNGFRRGQSKEYRELHRGQAAVWIETEAGDCEVVARQLAAIFPRSTAKSIQGRKAYPNGERYRFIEERFGYKSEADKRSLETIWLHHEAFRNGLLYRDITTIILDVDELGSTDPPMSLRALMMSFPAPNCSPTSWYPCFHSVCTKLNFRGRRLVRVYFYPVFQHRAYQFLTNLPVFCRAFSNGAETGAPPPFDKFFNALALQEANGANYDPVKNRVLGRSSSAVLAMAKTDDTFVTSWVPEPDIPEGMEPDTTHKGTIHDSDAESDNESKPPSTVSTPRRAKPKRAAAPSPGTPATASQSNQDEMQVDTPNQTKSAKRRAKKKSKKQQEQSLISAGNSADMEN